MIVQRHLIAIGLLSHVFAGPVLSDTCDNVGVRIEQLNAQYLAGKLDTAQSNAEKLLACPNAHAEETVTLHLKLAAIHDRRGLHFNTRPVAASLSHIDLAELASATANLVTKANVTLMRARYHYRAEMRDREFAEAEKYARLALSAFESEKDLYGQADAVHLIGLIFFQRRDLAPALEHFEKSLILENQTGEPRAIMLGDYGRHVGFVYLRQNKTEEAIGYLKSSLDARKAGKIWDAAMFAAITYASALADVGKLEDATATIQEALDIADRISSPSGKVRALATAGKIYEIHGDLRAAQTSYENALVIAETIKLNGSIRSLKSSLKRLSQ